ncbi:NYN domain-containing protein [Eleftheria terrae]|uniref:NYN domain-containing protein n=1 Tax=Eleftheria terrae TaxID=1597781 RepID=UPI00263B9F67|nr:NYN domain-containing protein [Eleftheria terrae]WKB55521.1 NYN domain-containing protein [Eleftheria terrae]
MASNQENTSMALFCDFENVALGVRDANYEKFDIKRVLERLLLKGSIVVKKAYCDWDRYKGFKAAMHEANFELIEIPHVRQSGKNSADIRLVVDALDLCYTKSHVNTFVIISGDSDFSPLVSKLRENAKQVIGVGVKKSTSDLLIANCDEFIFYDDLVREGQRAAAKRSPQDAEAGSRRTPEEDRRRREEAEARRSKAIDIAVETFEALVSERGDGGKLWASVLKDAIKRRKPDFSESYFGFRTFGALLEEAQSRGLFEVGRDEKSNAYVYRGTALSARSDAAAEAPAALRPVVPSTPRPVEAEAAPSQPGAPDEAPVPGEADARGRQRRGGRQAPENRRGGSATTAQEDRGRSSEGRRGPRPAPQAEPHDEPPRAVPEAAADVRQQLDDAEALAEHMLTAQPLPSEAPADPPESPASKRRGGRKAAAKKTRPAAEAPAAKAAAEAPIAVPVPAPALSSEPAGEAAAGADAAAPRPARKAASRPRRPRKAAGEAGSGS